MGSFQLALDAFVDEFERKATQVVKKIGLEVYSRIVIRTPVDIGLARGNWLVAIGRMPREERDKLMKAPVTAPHSEPMPMPRAKPAASRLASSDETPIAGA